MRDEVMIGGGMCVFCGAQYGDHRFDCDTHIKQNQPRRFRIRCADSKHPNGTESVYRYGCYFPMTDLVIGDMGARGTGEPKSVEWIDTN